MRFQATAGNNSTNTALDSAAQFAKQKTTTPEQANLAANPSDHAAGLTKPTPRDQQQPVGLAKAKTSSSQDQTKAVKQASSQVKTKTSAASKTGK